MPKRTKGGVAKAGLELPRNAVKVAPGNVKVRRAGFIAYKVQMQFPRVTLFRYGAKDRVRSCNRGDY